ncbi:MAG TPA: tryptophan synthase subunit alpha [Albitalea sp.]|uniref:tryptophan synthase subunit alpha n=1 Tax=Piscinibacter sp. TaxID=1903157 RepID=UPI002ED54561
MNRFDKLFDRPDRRAFIPFFTLGDPTPKASLDIIRAAVDAGADALELGFPFSDPITDGPVNQRSMQRALKAGVTYAACVEMVREIRSAYPDLAIGLLLYYNLLFMRGDSAYQELADIGIDAVVCSDLPLDESFAHMQALRANGLGCIQMVAPNTGAERARRLIGESSAFTYVISRFGTTGSAEDLEPDTLARVHRLGACQRPLVVGFGISKVSHVRELWKAGAHGVIIGSLFSLKIEKNPHDCAPAVEFIRNFISQIQAGKPCLDYPGVV